MINFDSVFLFDSTVVARAVCPFYQAGSRKHFGFFVVVSFFG